jgi:glycerate kinase
MRFVIAPDAFKGSLTAFEAADAMAAGVRDAFPDSNIVTLPLADGGEGTLAVLQHYGGGERMHDSLDTPHGCHAAACLRQEGRAVIESAQLIGLTLPSMQSTPVMQRSSRALGALIRQLMDEGVRDFVIGLGGSATNDGGLGMLMALGLQAHDAAGKAVTPDANGLLQLASIDAGPLADIRRECHFTILSDVTSPLCGKTGATAVYGPQKGLAGADVMPLDAAMHRYAGWCRADLMDAPGAGAAGGLGFALLLLGGTMHSGADYVIAASGLETELAGADWLLTGEGRSDSQTLHGKLPLRAADLARHLRVNTALVAGDIDASSAALLADHFDAVVSARPAGMAVQTAIAQAEPLLRAVTAAWVNGLRE